MKVENENTFGAIGWCLVGMGLEAVASRPLDLTCCPTLSISATKVSGRCFRDNLLPTWIRDARSAWDVGVYGLGRLAGCGYLYDSRFKGGRGCAHTEPADCVGGHLYPNGLQQPGYDGEGCSFAAQLEYCNPVLQESIHFWPRAFLKSRSRLAEIGGSVIHDWFLHGM